MVGSDAPHLASAMVYSFPEKKKRTIREVLLRDKG